MGGEQAAGVLAQVTRDQRAREKKTVWLSYALVRCSFLFYFHDKNLSICDVLFRFFVVFTRRWVRPEDPHCAAVWGRRQSLLQQCASMGRRRHWPSGHAPCLGAQFECRIECPHPGDEVWRVPHVDVKTRIFFRYLLCCTLGSKFGSSIRVFPHCLTHIWVLPRPYRYFTGSRVDHFLFLYEQIICKKWRQCFSGEWTVWFKHYLLVLSRGTVQCIV